MGLELRGKNGGDSVVEDERVGNIEDNSDFKWCHF